MKKLLNIIILIAMLSSCGKLSQCEYLYGIDVSHHNGNVDWNLVSSDSRIGFAYIKATEGKTYVDPTFHKNITEAKRNNILAGPYHFYSLYSSPEAQFNNLRSVCPRRKTKLVPMLDIEFERPLTQKQINQVRRDIKILADLCEDYYGKKPLLYCSTSVYNSCLYGVFSDNYPLCLSCPSRYAPKIIGTKHYDLWQFTFNGMVKGHKQAFDMHRMHEDFELRRLFI